MKPSARAVAVLALLGALTSGCSLTGPPVRRFIDDLTISERVRERLARANAALATIDIDTFEGTVYLNGPIESQAAKQEAEALAQGVDDVEMVVNNLHVPAPRGGYASPSTTGD
jgi:osmotically-inducible protein OsmY